jgi:3',5'-cyclic AMP phosphodiesterase CpdA
VSEERPPKTILHVSDLHFGERHAHGRAEALLEVIRRTRPTVVVVSGDLTRRARTREFREARAFLDRIERPLLVVPGNHDVPLWNPLSRFLSPLEKWRRFISDDPAPVFADEDMTILGVDTTRSFTISGGRLSSEDFEAVRERLCALPSDVFKGVVAHHPFVVPPGHRGHKAVGGADEALRFFERCGVDAVLTGHLHVSHAASSKDLYPSLERHIVLVQAGTATTTRGRGHERDANSFNLVEVRASEIAVSHLLYGEEGFRPGTSSTFPRHRPAA